MSNYKKEIIGHPKFYIVKFLREKDTSYLIFVHGGPGLNCGILEYLIEHENLFKALNYNIVLYDQRTCGRSARFPDQVSHADNVADLNEICQWLIKSESISIKGLMAHSYGVKLLCDFYKQFKPNIPAVFISMARSILTPRLNNLILDLSYLKTKDRDKYQEVFQKMDNLDFNKLWKLTEELAPLFQENKNRPYLYWANLDSFKKVQEIQKKINLPMNAKTFISVRKDLYSDMANYSVDIKDLKISCLWINGLHDYVMNDPEGFSEDSDIISFYKSAHYPHIEENERFSKVVNEFIKKEA